MTSVSNIWKLVKLVGDADDGKPGQRLEDTPKGMAMQDVVSEVLARPDLKETNLANQKLSAAYFFAVTSILPEMSDSNKQNSAGFTLDKEKKTALTTPGPNAVYQTTIAGDFYTRLGITKDATKSEIDQAYRNWAKENHPDVLRSKNADSSVVAKAEENAILMGEAYNTLKSPKLRPEYDKFWDENFAGKTSSTFQIKKDIPLLGDSDETTSPYIAMAFAPSTNSKPSKEVTTQTQSFQQMVMEQGAAGVNPFFISELKLGGLLPDGFSESQLTNAVHLYSRGIKSEDLLTATRNTSFLSESETGELNNTALFIEFLEASGSAEIPGSGVIGEATGHPSFLMIQSDSSETPSQNLISFKRNDEGGLSFIFDEAGGFVKDKAGGFIKKEGEKIAAKTAIGKAIKEGGKKILKEGSKVLAKTGVKLAGKAGLSAFFESLNAIAPGLGTILDVLINYVGPFLFGAIKSFFKAISDPETLGKILMIAGIGLAGLGMMGGGLFAGGVGAFSYFRAKGGGNMMKGINGAFTSFGVVAGAALAMIAVSITWPLIIALVIIPLTLAMVLFIITSGAYVVPPTPMNTPSQIINPYLLVNKTVRSVDPNKCIANGPSSMNCENSELSLTVEYVITITALRGPITITDVNHTCVVENESGNSTPTCDAATPAIEGTEISPTSPYVFTDINTYDQRYIDSLVTNTFTVTATLSEGGSTSSSSSASVCIGDCPEDCPSGYPVLPQNGQSQLQVSQGPYATASHRVLDGIDITSMDGGSYQAFNGHVIQATHSGTMCVPQGEVDRYGSSVYIVGKCNGRRFATVYAHIVRDSAMLPSRSHVTKGQSIAIGDDTGGWNFPHLHYEFANVEEPSGGNECTGFYGAPRGSAIPFRLPYFPKTVPTGCFWNCGVTIP